MTRVGDLTVIVADDDAGVRSALSDLLVDHPGLDLVGVAADGSAAAALCAQLRPHLAVVDVMMPGGGVAAIAAIREASPRTAVVVYTARADRRTRERMLGAGAVEVVVKGGAADVAAVLVNVGQNGARDVP